MEIFHYLAHVLRNIRNFEHGEGLQRNNGEKVGAAYNDIDFDTSEFLLHDFGDIEELESSQMIAPNEFNRPGTSSNNNEFDRPGTSSNNVDAVELSTDSISSDTSTSFDHPLFDNKSHSPDETYLEKVYDLVCTVAWNHIETLITPTTTQIYQQRKEKDWCGADSVYDAWLLRKGNPRKWFPYNHFKSLFPDWKEAMQPGGDCDWLDNSSSSETESESMLVSVSNRESQSELESFVPNVKKEHRFQPLTYQENVIHISSDDEEDVKGPIRFQPFKKCHQTIEISDDDED